MDVRARVTWEDGSETAHCIKNMPDEAAGTAQERLERSLADYLDEDEWPVDQGGLPLAWISVTLAKRSS